MAGCPARSRRPPLRRGRIRPLPLSAQAGPKPETYWQVDDVRAQHEGRGPHHVMKGTKVEPFQAEVLGVLKNTSPGRDLGSAGSRG